jgi:hypothetical protein
MLYSLLAGFELGAHSFGQKVSTLGELRPFSIWVAKKLGFTSYTRGWYNMIAEKTTSDEEAFELFFQLLDQYKVDSATNQKGPASTNTREG